MIGATGVVVSFIGPYMTLLLTDVFEREAERERIRKENVRKMKIERMEKLQNLREKELLP